MISFSEKQWAASATSHVDRRGLGGGEGGVLRPEDNKIMLVCAVIYCSHWSCGLNNFGIFAQHLPCFVLLQQLSPSQPPEVQRGLMSEVYSTVSMSPSSLQHPPSLGGLWCPGKGWPGVDLSYKIVSVL